MPSVVMALDRALRRFGSAPTYALTDNERTVSVGQVCGIAVRNPQIVSVGRHYGLTVATCVPADPESKGGSEATVKIARGRHAFCVSAVVRVTVTHWCVNV
jgi:transposase